MAEEQKNSQPRREVVGVFNDAASLEAATDALLACGFQHAQISLLAGEEAVAAKLGHKYQKVEELEDDPAAPRIAYRSNASIDAAKNALLETLVPIGAVAAAGAIFASGGAWAAVLGTGLLGAEVGGFLAGALGETVEDRHAKYLREQLDHGGLLLWVRVFDDAGEQAAKEILAKHSGRDVHAHALAAVPEPSPLK